MKDLKGILSGLDAALRGVPGGDDGFTRAELAEAMGISEPHAGHKIRQWHRAGLIRVGSRRAMTITGHMKTVPCYTPIHKGRKK